MSMSPPTGIDRPDPAAIMQFMPLIFTFTMAQVAVGLVIYWSWSNVLTILQQYVIMRRFKVDNPIDRFIAASPQGAGGVSSPRRAAFDAEAIEAARVLFARPGVVHDGLRRHRAAAAAHLPEVAFAGRSNVGKSSLINALVGRHGLARASNEPGRTREVNFFLLDERCGWSTCPATASPRRRKKTADKFQNLGRAYLRGRPNLKRVYLLIDARHGLKAPTPRRSTPWTWRRCPTRSS
jgi:hypothetical protein